MRITLKGTVRKLGVLTLSTVVALALTELALRGLDMHNPQIWTPHPELGWEHVPGAERHFTDEGDGWVVINPLGFRDKDRSIEKPAGTYRILVFGDSMTEAAGVNLDESYCYRIEESLTTDARAVEVWNLGVSGYSPIQEYLLMRREVPRFKPDLVILSVFVDNDVSGCSPILNVDGNSSEAPFVILQEDGTLKIDLSLPQASYDDFQREPKYTLRKWLGLYRQLYALKVQLAARAAGRDADDYIPPRYRLYQDPSPEVWDGAWRVFERMVLEFVAEANRLGVPVVIFSVPTPQVVNVASWTALEEKFPAMRKLKWDVAGPEQRLARLAQRNKLELIQPYRLFVDAPKDPELYFKGIGHPTVRGHQLIATAITDHLRKRNGWVD